MRLSKYAILFLAGIVIIGYLSYQNYTLSTQNNSEINSYNSLVTLYNNLTSNYNKEISKYNSLNSNYAYALSQLNKSIVEYNSLLGNYTRMRIVYQYPASNNSIAIWTYPFVATIPARVANRSPSWEEWELLDTFDSHIQLTANQTVQVVLFSLSDFLNFYAGKPYTTVLNETGDQFSFDEYISEGCGVYVLIIFNNLSTTALLTPNITATYAPTSFSTGTCADP